MQGKKTGCTRSNSVAIRAFYSLTGAAAMLLLNAGCMVGPDYAKPKPKPKPKPKAEAEAEAEADVETNWINQFDPRISRREAQLGEWWKVFKDPDLERLVEEARRQIACRRKKSMVALA